MFTTELVHRVILTVLLLGALGNCANQQQESDEQNQDPLHPHHHEQDQGKRGQKDTLNLSIDKDDTSSSSSSSSSSSPLSRSIPSFETRNYHDYYRNRYYRNRDSTSSASSSSPYHPFELDRPNGSQQLSSSTSSSSSSSSPSSSSSSSSSSIAPEMSTVISSTSYSIKPGSSGSGSNVYINTKPTPIIISGHPTSSNINSNSGGHQGSSSPFSSYFSNNNPRRGGGGSSSNGGNSCDSDRHYTSSSSSTTDCFNGRNCPKGDDDEYKSYYSVLNGNLKYPERLGASSTMSVARRRYEEQQRAEMSSSSTSDSDNIFYDRRTIFPFNVHGIGPNSKHRFYPNSDSDQYPKRRVTRTSTTSSPSWVKLQPIPAHKFYDPFLAKDNDVSASSASSKYDLMGSGNEKYENVQFANRIGIELSPESFAERWGYGNGISHSKSSTLSGSRLPSWLEELNHHHKHHHTASERRPYSGPTRDEDPQNWVKLDPIPVAGVSISKWVPKGTASSDLPSTGNLIRDKPSAWWDHRHHETHLPHLKPPSLGWGSASSAFNNRYPPPHEIKRPHNDPWKDIIYPDTPASATASWEANTANSVLKGPSSFPSSSLSSHGGWKSETQRRPSVASWTAPLSTNSASSTNRFAILRPGGNSGSHGGGHQIPNNYPDPTAHDDDPRWVLVSNSRRVTQPQLQQSFSDRHKYRPPIGYRDDLDTSFETEMERERDRMPQYKPHRLAKDYKLITSPSTNTNDIKKNTAQIQQDEAFRKINATLQNLTPVFES